MIVVGPLLEAKLTDRKLNKSLPWFSKDEI